MLATCLPSEVLVDPMLSSRTFLRHWLTSLPSGLAGWLARDHVAWHHSHEMIKQLERLFKARLIFGHDKETAEQLIAEKKYFE